MRHYSTNVQSKTHPRTMVVKSIDAVVTQTAMGSAWWTEDFARKTVFEFDRLALDQNLFGTRRWPECGTVERIGYL